MPFKTKGMIERYVFLELKRDKIAENIIKDLGNLTGLEDRLDDLIARSGRLQGLDDSIMDLFVSMNPIQLALAKSVYLEQTGILKE